MILTMGQLGWMVLVIAVISIMLPSGLDAFAAELSLSQKPALLEHGIIINLTNPSANTAAANESLTVIINSTQFISGCPVTVTEIGSTGKFYSQNFVNLTSRTTGNCVNYIVNVTTGQNSVSAVYSADSLIAYTDVESNADSAWPGDYYQNARTTGMLRNCNSYGGDADSDGICDSWEPGTTPLTITYPSAGSGNPNYQYTASPYPTKSIKDIYVEIDWLKGHKPDRQALDQIKDIFSKSKSGTYPIQLHLQIDEEIPYHFDKLRFPGNSVEPGFDQLKNQWFGTKAERTALFNSTLWKQKMHVFHYAIWAHDQWEFPGSSGIAEERGNDLAVTMGAFEGSEGSTDRQAATFMHELGHNIGLDHGGGWNDQKNCKPNYISIMSYSRQFNDLIPNRMIDYSNKSLGAFNASNGLIDLLEVQIPSVAKGVPSYSSVQPTTIYGINNGGQLFNKTGDTFKWDNGNKVREIKDSNGNWVCAPIASGQPDAPPQTLQGHDDWSNIDLKSRGTDWRGGRGAISYSQISIESNSTSTQYNPFKIQVFPNVAVTWANHDSAAHTVTSGTPQGGPDGTFDSGLIPPGSSFSHVFTQGNQNHEYYCTVHPWETGKVQVLKLPDSKDPIEKKFKDGAWCFTEKEANHLNNKLKLDKDVIPLCTGPEMNVKHVRAAQSIRVDLLKSAIADIPEEHFIGQQKLSQNHIKKIDQLAGWTNNTELIAKILNKTDTIEKITSAENEVNQKISNLKKELSELIQKPEVSTDFKNIVKMLIDKDNTKISQMDIEAIKNALASEPSKHFKSKNEVKQSYFDKLEEIRSDHLNGKSSEAYIKYIELRRTFDGLGDDDLIENPTSAAKILAINNENMDGIEAVIAPEFGHVVVVIMVAGIIAVISFTRLNRFQLRQF